MGSSLMPLCSSNRPTRTRGSAAVEASEGGGAEPRPSGAAGLPEKPSRRPSGGSDPDSPSCRPQTSLGVFRSRSIFHLPRRSSSGYFSADGSDSVPGSPLSPRPLTVDKSTQTRSPSGQVIAHALERVADEARGGGRRTQPQNGFSLNPSSGRRRNAAEVMRDEEFGRKLQHIGDEYNRLVLQRGAAARRPGVYLNLMPNLHQEPVTVLCFGFLLLLLGRILYLQGITNSQDHSQV